MITVRHQTFETNSSSTHTVVVARSAKEKISETKGVEIYQRDFGREWAKYNDMLTKAAWLHTASAGEPSDYFRTAYPKESKIIITARISWLKAAKELGLVLIKPEPGKEEYVDHGTSHVSTWLKTVPQLAIVDEMKKFITSSKFWLITGCDESTPPPNHYLPPSEINKLPMLVTMEYLTFKESARSTRNDAQDIAESLAELYIQKHTRRKDYWHVYPSMTTDKDVTITVTSWKRGEGEEIIDRITLPYTVTDAPYAG